MEEWQIDCIISNLDKLIQTTICNVLLLTHLVASKILSNQDMQIIEAERESFRQAKRLYEILQTRMNAFSSLARALHYYNQSGALEILKSSFLKQDVKKVLSTSYTFNNWTNLLANVPDSLLQKTVQLHKEEYIQTFLFLEKQTEFATDTIPNRPPYYVSRSISNRLLLDPKIFKVDCSDVFVFKDVERHKLSKLVKPLGTESSMTQMVELTSKFIHLNEEADFLIICQNRKNKPVHLVKFEAFNLQECLILEESHGNSQVLRYFLDKSRNHDRCFVSEDEFIQNIKPDDQSISNGYCICDSPGSGKTWLLASLARKMKSKYSERIIVFEKLLEIDFLTGSKDDSADYLVSKLCHNPFVKFIIKSAVDQNIIKMEVFLDAFDEVDVKHIEAAKRFLLSLRGSSENVRIFVTSRPHTRHELESTLGVISYDIRAFDKQNQLDFLEQCWRYLVPCSIDVLRLKDFARACQAKVQSSLSRQEKDIMGIPLQCFMIAEIYLHKVKMYCINSKATLNQFLNSPASLFEIYKHFIAMKLNETTAVSAVLLEERKRIHTWIALNLFSPKLASLYKQTVLQDKEFSDADYLSSGLLVGVVKADNRLHVSFVHQTFAEYLVATFISDILTDMQKSHDNFRKLKICVMEFVANKVFRFGNPCGYSFRMKYSPTFDERWPTPVPFVYTVKNTVIPFFLNEHLKFTFSSDSQNVKTDFLLEDVGQNHFLKILSSCVMYGWLYIIKFFTRQLKMAKEKPEIFLLYRYVLLGPQNDGCVKTSVVPPVFLLCLAAKYSNLLVLKQCVQFYEECFDYNCIDAIRQTPVWAKTPYHEALERGDYSMVEYFTKFELPFGNRWLLHQCIHDTNQEEISKIHIKINILELLLSDKEYLVWDMKTNSDHGPLLASLLATPRINLKFIKYVIQKVRDNMPTSLSAVLAKLDFETIKSASQYINEDKFHELCRIFFEDLNISRTANTRQQLADTLRLMLERTDFKNETLQMVLKQLSSIEILDLSSELLYHATLGNQSAQTIELLVKEGVNLFATDEKGFSVIHYAAKLGNQHLFKYLLTKGFSVNQQTVSGMTPLMVSAESYPEMLLFILKNGASISMREQNGETFFEKFARKFQSDQLNFSPDTFRELVAFLFNQPEAMEIFKSTCWKQIWPANIKSAFYVWRNLREFCEKSTLILFYENLELDFSCLTFGWNRNNVLLEAITRKMSLDFIEKLFEYEAGINFTNKNGQNALHLAAKCHNCQTVAYVLKKSCLPINGKDRDGNTPLHLAISFNFCSLEIAKFLLKHGADPFILNLKKETFAHEIAGKTSGVAFCELISLLQRHTGDSDVLNKKNQNGQTLLHVRLKNNVAALDNLTINQIRDNQNIDVNLADKIGNTIFLLLAKRGDYWDLVKVLAKTRACITSKTSEGYTVLHYAAIQGNLEMVQYFHSLGLPLDDENVDGDTAILLAYRHLPVIKYLYTEGCNICAVNKKGKTILHPGAFWGMDKKDTFLDLVLFLRECKITQPFVHSDLEFRRTAIHQLLHGSVGLPSFLVNWIVNLPEYDISAEDIEGNTIFQTAIVKCQELETCIVDTIYNTYCASVEPKALNCALLKALTASVDSTNSNAVRFLLQKSANPNPRDINAPMLIDVVIKRLNEDKNRQGYTFFQLNLILKQFLTYMLGDKRLLCATDNHGNTFLHGISACSHPDDFQLIVAEICTKGFTDIISMKNKNGKSPIQIAEKNNRLTEETRKVLSQNGISTDLDSEVTSDSDKNSDSDLDSDSDSDSE